MAWWHLPILHAGDLLFNGSYPFIDTSSGGSFDGLLEALDHLLEMAGPETRIIPGHGPLASRADLERTRAMLTRVRAAISPLVERGLSADETVAAKPTAALDEEWGGGFMTPERFVRIVHGSLSATR